MSFPCPVEGCTSVYPDWKSLREHLSEEHGQDATQESYRAWMEEVESNRITEQQQQQEQQHNSNRTGPLITPLERDVSLSVPSDTSLSCPVCGKVFDRGDLMSSFNSVKMHCIKSHGRKLQPYELGLGEEEKAPSPPKRPAARAEEEGRPSIPDPYEHLRQMLITFGLGDKNAGAVCKFMESYSVDDLYKLIEGAAEYLPRSRLKLFIESWANVRGIPIAPGLQEELGISNMPTSYGRYGYQQYDRSRRRDRDFQSEPKDEVSKLIDQQYDDARKIAMIKALHGGEENGSEVQGLRREIKELRMIMREGLSEKETEKISELEDEIREKDRKLQEERDQRHRNELKALEERMDSRIEALKSSQGTVFERQSVKAVERVGDVGERMVTLGEKLIVATAFKHGILESEPLLPRERQGPAGIESLIPEEFIERQVKEVTDA